LGSIAGHTSLQRKTKKHILILKLTSNRYKLTPKSFGFSDPTKPKIPFFSSVFGIQVLTRKTHLSHCSQKEKNKVKGPSRSFCSARLAGSAHQSNWKPNQANNLN